MVAATRRLNFPIFLLVGLAVSVAAAAIGANGNVPTWSKKGTDFPGGCDNKEDWDECKPLEIRSPDHKNVVDLRYAADPYDPGIEVAELTVFSNGKRLGEVVPPATVEDEVVWSPDSKAFFITGNNNANGWDESAVHLLSDPDLGPGNIFGDVQQDMARSFPPCRAKYYHPANCAEYAAHPDEYIGVIGLDWIGGSLGVVVMAEVPCSSYWGGIMCQVLGYEVEVPSGKILRRMEPREFKRRWQKSMAWNFEIPDPPEYEKK